MTLPDRNRKRLTLAVASVVAASLVYACDDDEEDDDDGAGGNACPAATATAGPTSGPSSTSASSSSGAGGGDGGGPTVMLKEAKLNIEHNATDLDTGFQGALDGEGWQRLEVIGPEGKIIMPAAPEVGDAYYQEVAPDIAEDMARVGATGRTETFAGMSYDNVIQVFDANPIDDEDPCEEEEKFYVPGIGEAGDAGKLLVMFTPGM